MAKVKFSIYLEEDLKKELEADAEREHRTLVGAVAKAVSFYLENKDKIILEKEELIKTVPVTTHDYFQRPVEQEEEFAFTVDGELDL